MSNISEQVKTKNLIVSNKSCFKRTVQITREGGCGSGLRVDAPAVITEELKVDEINDVSGGGITIEGIILNNGTISVPITGTANCIQDIDIDTMVCANDNNTVTIDVNGTQFGLAEANGNWRYGGDLPDITTLTGLIGKADPAPIRAGAIPIIASGNFAHAEGLGTTASGDYSHAEGAGTRALQEGCHAEGILSLADGLAAHAEGGATVASGDYSHAEGDPTLAAGRASHAEGSDTSAHANNSHAEGSGTTAGVLGSPGMGENSHAEGFGTMATGLNSHAQGDECVAAGENSTAAGHWTMAGGLHADAWGYSNDKGVKGIATGDASHSEGWNTIASGNYSHAEGYGFGSGGMVNMCANGVTQGEAMGLAAHSEGWINFAEGDFSHAEGRFNLAQGIGSHAEGECNSAIGIASHAEGTITPNAIKLLYSLSDVTNGTVANADGSHTEGYSTIASADAAHAEGIQTIADGPASHAAGIETVARGIASHAEGRGTLVIGDYSHAEGRGTTVIGDYSHVSGDFSQVEGNYSYAGGHGGYAFRSNMWAYGLTRGLLPTQKIITVDTDIFGTVFPPLTSLNIGYNPYPTLYISPLVNYVFTGKITIIGNATDVFLATNYEYIRTFEVVLVRSINSIASIASISPGYTSSGWPAVAINVISSGAGNIFQLTGSIPSNWTLKFIATFDMIHYDIQ